MTHYQTLGLAPFATDEQIKAAYRKLAAKYHPDVQATGDADRFLAIAEAYKALLAGSILPADVESDQVRRAAVARLRRDISQLKQQMLVVNARIVTWDKTDHRIPKMKEPIETKLAECEAEIEKLLASA